MTDDRNLDSAVLTILAGVLDVDVQDLAAGPVLSTHSWTSLTSLEALAQLEGEFNISLDLRTFSSVRTAPEMVALVAAQRGPTATGSQ
jgi:acyl carrier protein